MPHKKDKLESKEAAKDGASLVANSGRGKDKGDARLPGYLLDYKHNEKTFTITAENWSKHRKDAWKDRYREPVISVVFGDGTKLAIIDWQIFMDFIGENNE
jgi:hypothetical protein